MAVAAAVAIGRGAIAMARGVAPVAAGGGGARYGRRRQADAGAGQQRVPPVDRAVGVLASAGDQRGGEDEGGEKAAHGTLLAGPSMLRGRRGEASARPR